MGNIKNEKRNIFEVTSLIIVIFLLFQSYIAYKIGNGPNYNLYRFDYRKRSFTKYK